MQQVVQTNSSFRRIPLYKVQDYHPHWKKSKMLINILFIMSLVIFALYNNLEKRLNI